ncbi:MAG: biotin--[acetyl-CoA-carboxylase] ligase [Candidatus Poribacteria bacterium]|nr:biotin--[acetyl-CoA-carboxylase] ligase [Candidatus Poribacteria bacterium]
MDFVNFREKLKNRIVGKPDIVYISEVTSTNDVAIDLTKNEEAEEGTLVITDYQSAGRGRYGRTWIAPSGKCILASVVFRHRLKQEQVHLPNLIGALAIAQGIHTVTGLSAKIKHPNDVRIEKVKVAGVLTEIEYDLHRHPFFVLGFGVNVNISINEFPIELRNTATSLQVAASDKNNNEICRLSVLQAILEKLEEHYLTLKSGNVTLIEDSVRFWEEKE